MPASFVRPWKRCAWRCACVLARAPREPRNTASGFVLETRRVASGNFQGASNSSAAAHGGRETDAPQCQQSITHATFARESAPPQLGARSPASSPSTSREGIRGASRRSAATPTPGPNALKCTDPHLNPNREKRGRPRALRFSAARLARARETIEGL